MVWGLLEGLGVLVRRSQRGENEDNLNSIINKMPLKMLHKVIDSEHKLHIKIIKAIISPIQCTYDWCMKLYSVRTLMQLQSTSQSVCMEFQTKY